ncbi:MAG: hypothetical protein KJZ70_18495 [Bryobacterales bacterium]|nr:hypothetical protein [Bryobacterales bacterium]
MDMSNTEPLVSSRHRCCQRGAPSLWTGFLILIAGVVLLLSQMGIISMSEIWRFWPVALIVVGFAGIWKWWKESR